MQSEQINFTYILGVSALTTPVTVTASVNGAQVAVGNITKNGRFEFLVRTDLATGIADLILDVGDTNKAIITVNAIKMQWVKENSNINPVWTNREAGPGEIWNYGMPESVWSAEINASYHGTVILDYEVEGRKSYLRNYATVLTGNKQFNLKDKPGPFSFKDSGQFCLKMSSPLSYWLMERLFVAV